VTAWVTDLLGHTRLAGLLDAHAALASEAKVK
jgi:hypothetical protein